MENDFSLTAAFTEYVPVFYEPPAAEQAADEFVLPDAPQGDPFVVATPMLLETAPREPSYMDAAMMEKIGLAADATQEEISFWSHDWVGTEWTPTRGGYGYLMTATYTAATGELFYEVDYLYDPVTPPTNQGLYDLMH